MLVVTNVVSGAAVRLSDSGLGCPDWPDCSAHHFTPPLALHPAIEFGNRMVVGVLTAGLVVTLVAAWRRAPHRRDLTALAGALVGGVVAEALVGYLVVRSHLNPYVVMAHFLLGMAMVTAAVVLCLRAGRAPAAGRPVVSHRVVVLTRALLVVLAAAVTAGTATTGAGPHAGAAPGPHGGAAPRIGAPLIDLVRTHSTIALAAAGLTVVVLLLLVRTGAPTDVADRGKMLLAAMVAQGVVGYTQYFTHLPALLVGIHVFGATVVWSAAVWFADGLRRHEPEPAPAPEPARGAPAHRAAAAAR